MATNKEKTVVHTEELPKVSKELVNKNSVMDGLRRALQLKTKDTILVVDNKKLRKFELNFTTGECKELPIS